MTVIDAAGKNFDVLNEEIWNTDGDAELTGCLGQRFIAAGIRGRKIVINGVPGNALGAYLTGAEIIVNGNAQDAVGDTMNDGRIVVQGSVGDAVGYAMRGGEIYIQGNAGYRAGIHMKEYESKKPVIVIGGRAGCFLGEYQAGGRIIVLGLHDDGKPVIGNFPCMGMHGGRIFIQGDVSGTDFPSQTTARRATREDIDEILPYIRKYCESFGCDISRISLDDFTVVEPDSANPYKQMYVAN